MFHTVHGRVIASAAAAALVCAVAIPMLASAQHAGAPSATAAKKHKPKKKTPKGIAGPRGPAGKTGATGATGSQGPAGANGTNGANGAAGTNGAPGPGATALHYPLTNPGSLGIDVGPFTLTEVCSTEGSNTRAAFEVNTGGDTWAATGSFISSEVNSNSTARMVNSSGTSSPVTLNAIEAPSSSTWEGVEQLVLYDSTTGATYALSMDMFANHNVVFNNCTGTGVATPTG